MMHYSYKSSIDGKQYRVVASGNDFQYLIDPISESCILIGFDVVRGSYFGGSVDCKKLKANLPETSEFITWIP